MKKKKYSLEDSITLKLEGEIIKGSLLDELTSKSLNIICSRIGHEGVKLLENIYYNEKLQKKYGEPILVRYEPNNLDNIYCFTTGNEFICKASKIKSNLRDKK